MTARCRFWNHDGEATTKNGPRWSRAGKSVEKNGGGLLKERKVPYSTYLSSSSCQPLQGLFPQHLCVFGVLYQYGSVVVTYVLYCTV